MAATELVPTDQLYKLFTLGSKSEAYEAFDVYEGQTMSAWRCCLVEKQFGLSLDELKLRETTRQIRWSIKAEKGIDIKFDGVPFFFIGRKIWTCHQGPDLDIRSKEKRQRKKEMDQQELDHCFKKQRNMIQDSKKVNCPAMVYMTHVVRFPDFKIDEDKERPRKMQSRNVREKLWSGKTLAIEETFYVKFPHPSCHHHHPVPGIAASLRGPVDSTIVNKIHELYHSGVRLVKEFERHLINFVEDVVFKEGIPPPRSHRRWFPTPADIRNILGTAKSADRHVLDDQQNLVLYCDDLKKKYPDASVVFRPSTVKPDDASQQDDKLLFFYQTPWQKRLLKNYGEQMCLMDAAYRTSHYALPLFFICVRTNVNYSVVATFITHNEDTETLTEALAVLKEGNPEWIPKNFMVDYSLPEINALETCFPGTKVFICDCHREKAWNEWVCRKDHGLSHLSKEVLYLLRNVASSPTQELYNHHVTLLKSSKIWEENERFRNYYEKTWEIQCERWVHAFRDENLSIAIHTNNGIERQNEWLKSSYLAIYKNHSISELVKVLVDQFLPDTFKRYQEMNVRSSDGYSRYSDNVPKYLHNRPKDMVDHLMKRMSANIPRYHIFTLDAKSSRFQVMNEETKGVYSIWLGDTNKPPYCTCPDWRRYKLLCKHMCAILQIPGIGWDKLGQCYRDNPIFTLDQAVINGCNAPVKTPVTLPPSACTTTSIAEDEDDNDDTSTPVDSNSAPVTTEPNSEVQYAKLPSRKRKHSAD